MGVFPLADTMIRCSVSPWPRGTAPAGAKEWNNEVWWYPHPTTTRGNAAAVPSPTDSLNPSDPTCGAPAPAKSGRAGPVVRIGAPAVPELAVGTGLQ
jgi:hypothetical protein